MAHVKMITSAAGPQGVWPAGSVQIVDDAQARVLITHGFAEPVKAAPVEVAAVEPAAEVADAPVQRKPRKRRTSTARIAKK